MATDLPAHSDFKPFPLSIKLIALHVLFSRRRLSQVVDELDNDQLIAFQRFVWDKAVEFGILAKGKSFSHEDITRRMVSSAAYQQQQGCSEPVYTCKASHCIRTNSKCARQKFKGQLDVMADVIWEYLGQLKLETADTPTRQD